MQDQLLKVSIEEIENHLQSALAIAQSMQKHVESIEGDTDLYRKFAFYLTPSLNHWLVGVQAGNIKDLKETLARRVAKPEEKKMTQNSQQGDGHEVLTKPSA